MTTFLAILLLLLSLIAMEPVAYFLHKHIMHGVLWCLHSSHHRNSKSRHFFEKNDLLGILFVLLPAVLLIILAYSNESLFLLQFISYGMLLYGGMYTLVHGIIVHQRIKVKFKITHPYLRRIIEGHLRHHKTGEETYGFFYVPKKY